MRAIGEQLGKFVDIYLKESVTVIRNEKTGHEKKNEASSSTIRSKTFDAFLSMATEKEVEELLTYHARVKKSIDMFFGSPSEKKRTKEEEKDVNQQEQQGIRSAQLKHMRQPQSQSIIRGECSTNTPRGIIVKLPQPTLKQYPSRSSMQPPSFQTQSSSNKKYSTQDRLAISSETSSLRRPIAYPPQTAM